MTGTTKKRNIKKAFNFLLCNVFALPTESPTMAMIKPGMMASHERCVHAGGKWKGWKRVENTVEEITLKRIFVFNPFRRFVQWKNGMLR